MSDTMWLEGKEYISSRRASELSGYAQDYIGQLARKGVVDAQRVGGLWYISMPSLQGYKDIASTYVPQQPEHRQPVDVESLVSFDGKDHISAARAAKITGYHQDYVGQLARSGAIISRQVGNRWYVDRDGILAHKQEKDSLLGAVQAQSVGITRGSAPLPKISAEGLYSGAGPFLTYTKDNGDLLPALEGRQKDQISTQIQEGRSSEGDFDREYTVPIRVLAKKEMLHHMEPAKRVKSADRIHEKAIYYGTIGKLAAAALTIVIVLSFGFATFKNSSTYGTNIIREGSVIQRNLFTASAGEAIRQVGDFMANLFATELVYKRQR